MRKIEEQMNQAITNNETWKSGNTSVHYSAEYNSSTVYLHDNLIAIVDENDVEIFDGGWQTSTTKSRLNALINEFCDAVTDGIFQKDYLWFIRDNKEVKDFTSGYVFN